MKSQRKHPRVSISIDPAENMTKQSFKEECDINAIMAKFQRTGAITHYAKHAPEYGDVPAIDYQAALNLVILAQDSFAELPSSLRAKFHNSPSEFLEFVQNPENLAEMRELGLANPLVNNEPKTTPKKPAPAEAEPPTTPEPKGDG